MAAIMPMMAPAAPAAKPAVGSTEQRYQLARQGLLGSSVDPYSKSKPTGVTKDPWGNPLGTQNSGPWTPATPVKGYPAPTTLGGMMAGAVKPAAKPAASSFKSNSNYSMF